MHSDIVFMLFSLCSRFYHGVRCHCMTVNLDSIATISIFDDGLSNLEIDTQHIICLKVSLSLVLIPPSLCQCMKPETILCG